MQLRELFENTEADREIILSTISDLQKKLDKPVAIEVKPLESFYPAEEYHQKYLDKNPGGYCHIGGHKFEKARNAVDFNHQKSTLRSPQTPRRL